MSLSLAPQLTQRACRWKEIRSVWLTKALSLQFIEEGGAYTIWGYDGPEVHVCTIWTGTVPDDVIQGGYSQEQNDEDKQEFELGFRAESNKSITPRAVDGKPFYLPNIFPGEVLLNFAGRSDSGGTRYSGDLFGLSKEGEGDTSRDFSFQDGVYLAGGAIQWTGGGFGSSVKMELVAPATSVVDAAGVGNSNLVPVAPGLNLIVPAAGDGAKNLGSVITPIPANDDETNEQNGFWGYSDPWIGKGQISAGVPQKSKYNLLDQQLVIGHFTDLHLVLDAGTREFIVENIKPKWILPEWLFRVTIHNAHAEKTLQVGWDLAIARRKSV